MTKDSHPRFIRAVEDAQPEQQGEQAEALRTRLKKVEQRLRKKGDSSRETGEAMLALKDERNLLAVRFREQELTVEKLNAERSETAARIKSLEQELRLAWHKVDALEAQLKWKRRPFHRRAFGRTPTED